MDFSELTLVFAAVALSWLFLGLLVYRSKRKTLTLLGHAAVQFLYLLYFGYNLEYNSAGGVGLVWFFYGLLFLLLHTIIIIGAIVVKRR